MCITGIINTELWDKACWIGTAILSDKESAPYLGFLFQDKDSAIKIFEEWNATFGHRDIYEEIRIAIIEGEIAGKEHGYTVHISTNQENLKSKCKQLNLPIRRTLFAVISRFRRIPTDNDNRTIALFRDEFEKFLSYKIIPIYIHENKLEPLFDYEIEKTEIFFRQASEIADDDIDVVCTK